MINMKHILKVVSVWISAVYAVCFFGVALFPGVRPGFMMYGLHMNVTLGSDVLSLGTFLSGLIIWNAVALAGVWFFTLLFNKIK
jgi:hypothetical protein